MSDLSKRIPEFSKLNNYSVAGYSEIAHEEDTGLIKHSTFR